jgi:hypothetical protein
MQNNCHYIGEWSVTTDLQTALAGNYIGEEIIQLTPLMDAMTNYAVGPLTVYYYGKRDVTLSEKFGYPPESIQ